MIDHAEGKCLQLALDKYGPLYVRAVVPRYAKKHFDDGLYGAWYLAHKNEEYLEQEQVESYVSEFGEPLGGPDGLSGFMEFLETKGYIVLHSIGEEGVILVGEWED